MFAKVLTFALPCALLASAHAQSFNINFTGSPTIGPPSSYGGAAGQPGKWSSVTLNTSTPKPIKLLNGHSAGCLSILPSKPLSTFIWPDPKTCGTIESLLDSCAQVDTTGADIVISGVNPGNYKVWVYARHPISCWYQCPPTAWFTKATVNGVTAGSCGGGGGNCSVVGPYAGITHRVYDITVTASKKITIHVQPNGSHPFGGINGVQVQCLNGALKCMCSLTAAPVVHALAEAPSGKPIGEVELHHLQVHRELAGYPQTIVGQAHRRDANAPFAPGATARTIDLEVWAGEGDLDRVSSTFASNYTGRRVNVLRRQRVSLPDWTQQPRQAPAPFDFVLKYDQPLQYTGQGDFVWEMIVHSATRNGGHPMDAELPATERQGSASPLGVGCVALGQSEPLLATASITTYDSQSPRLTYRAAIDRGAPGATCAVLLGFQNPAFPIRLCRPDLLLYTDSRIAIQGRIGNNGSYRAPEFGARWEASLSGTPLFSQAVTIDAAGLTVSNGVVSPIPGLPERGPYAWVRASGSAGATRGTVELGAAIVTQILR